MTVQLLPAQKLNRLLNAPASSTPAPMGLDSPVLGLLAATNRKVLDKMMTEHHFGPGTIIFNEGDVGDAMYIIRSGRVVVVKGGFKSPTILGYRGVGETIGEMALLENRPRSAAVVATEDLCLLRINREDFQALREGNPSFEMSLSQALSARLRAADEARSQVLLAKKSLSRQISRLQTENEQLLELQRLRQDTSDFIVHDLRSPLSLVAGAINMLEMVLPEEVVQANRELLELADANCKRMQRMIDSLLDIARMEAGESVLRPTRVNLADLIKRAINRLNSALKSRNLTLSATLPAGLPTLTVDEEQIDRVLENLIDNAIKYSPTGGRIAIAAELKGAEVLVSIANTGPTIPATDREHIFERFAQATTLGFRTQGSGLGLAFCRLAIAAHGGQIWVEPGEGDEGNNFVFSLPLSKPPPNEC